MSVEPTKAAAGPSRRTAARLAAVQALYQWQEGQHAPAEIIEQFLKVRTGEAGEGGMRRDADRPLFKDVVEGTVSHKAELEQTVTGALADDWTWGRIDRLVRAILLAGAYELLHRGDVPARAILLGGTPFGEHLVMWWNFVGRSHDEIVAYREQWESHDARFGAVDGYRGATARLPAPPLPNGRLRPRGNPAP